MKNIFLINAHQPYPFSEGRLNRALFELADNLLQEKGYETRTSVSAENYAVEEELEKHQWADCIILQSPVNWMGVPLSFKKYLDEIYSAGMDGRLCHGDGRSAEAPTENYGTGGTLTGTKYLLSFTLNAPEAAFDNDNEYLLQGKSIDELLLPMHINFRFFDMRPLPTFACFDVMKNPAIESDMQRYTDYLNSQF